MNNINIPQLDTITKHIININNELIRVKYDIHTLDINSDYDLIIKIATPIIAFGSAIIVIGLFYLNRNKEFYIKKAELAGNIYLNIFEFKKLRNEIALFNIQNNLMNYIVDMENTNEYKEALSNHFKLDFDYLKDFNTYQGYKKQLEATKNELLKYLGSYSFYSKKNRKLINEYCENIIKDKFVNANVYTDTPDINKTILEMSILMKGSLKKEMDSMKNIFEPIKKIITDEKY